MNRRALAAALGLVVAMAMFSAAPAAAGDDPGEHLASVSTETAPSPYVEAASPAEAEKKLAALEAEGPMALAAAIEYGPCTLYPSVVYLRKSSNYSNVGTKPYTRCEVAVSSIRHSTDLRYKSFLWWRKATTKSGGNSGESSYTQRNVEYRCVSSESTAWSGTTAGTIIYRGKTYYARVYQPVKPLDCGG